MITDFDEYREELVSACMAERLELLSSTLNNCVLSILIATLLQHRRDLNKKLPPRSSGRFFWVLAVCLGIGQFCFIFKQNCPFFVVLTGLEPVTSPM